ncbi:hypothetical protein PE066_13680 [Ramlibacter tataouinensis]|uniref:hypothetical protein n=1 Tax=Ramlibacter tataouinensis TaxID=94132 RepID=UPI0022F3FE1E|nr:hypothetical protein [Ramlibacter tataouinensis]WBY00515.1 hypothetical protein PE066_13680 [Ramlibacter tataouinensis]
MELSIFDLVRAETYWQSRPHVFPSKESWNWYKRKHRAKMVEAGALLKLRGSDYVHAGNCDIFVLAAAQAAAGKPGDQNSFDAYLSADAQTCGQAQVVRQAEQQRGQRGAPAHCIAVTSHPVADSDTELDDQAAVGPQVREVG